MVYEVLDRWRWKKLTLGNCEGRLSNKISVKEILTKTSLSFNKTRKIACGAYNLNLCNNFLTKEWFEKIYQK